ncbi:TetR/AcrR family transcriptional regulator [Actinomyces sp. 432]|uniref:TetR/AcrR family transcriptional regulator n=1 Tax=Actinomyces sp. 432 TaxID=2057798 RepID=UPI001F33D20A|nr:TetR/AcrR family transcriptional regulator [Actinomyces sp. 432]
MPRVTQSYRDRQTARIVAAAEACFSRSGFDGASMDEIIAEAGMSSSTVYRYFPQGKESLVRAVLGQAINPVVDWMAGLPAAGELPHLSPLSSTPSRWPGGTSGRPPTVVPALRDRAAAARRLRRGLAQ